MRTIKGLSIYLLMGGLALIGAIVFFANPTVRPPDKKPNPILGEWKTFATNGSPVELTMTIAPDGTFSGTEQDGSGRVSSYSGTYRYSLIDFPSRGKMPCIDVTYKSIGGKPAPKDAVHRFLYDAKEDILTDLLTTGFCRPDQVEAKKRLLERQTNAPNADRKE